MTPSPPTTTGCALAVLFVVSITGLGIAAEAASGESREGLREAQTRHAAQQEARAAHVRRDRQRRFSAAGAHARMPSTMYASTPSPPDADPHCPVLRDLPAGPLEDVYDRIIRERSGGDAFRPSGSSPGTVARSRPWAQALRTTLDAAPAGNAANHGIEAAGGSAASGGAARVRHVHLFPPASDTLRQGFVRVVNHSAEAGEVRIDPVDDGGGSFDALTLSIGARAAVHFNSGDLENGNRAKGLSGATGPGQGSWRLALSSDLDVEVLAYVRTRDGFLTAMHDVAPSAGDVRRIAILNPGSNRSQASRLRLVNPSDAAAEVAVRGTDDRGRPGAGDVALTLDAGAARELTAAELESGAAGLSGALGDGAGKWRLEVESESPVVAMSLLESPTGHLTNLSTVPPAPAGGRHAVPLFPAAGDASGRQGFLRVVNRSETAGEVRVEAFDGTDRDYPPPTLSVGAGETAHFNSDDLEQGNARKGLSGGTGAGEGDWRLELTSDLDIEVLAYVRTQDGFLTAMHDVAPRAGNRHRIAVFNPGGNRRQESLLRLVNPGAAAAAVAISGIDDAGAAGVGEVRLTVPAGASRTLSARELEDGGDGLAGSLGDGAGKWRLAVESDAPVTAMSLLRSPTGHLTNLSTAPGRHAGDAAEDLFRTSISPIVQSKCVNCHVEGGLSGNTRLVFARAADDADHLATNLAVFRTFASEVDGAADLVLNKIQGVDHGGGIQVASGTDGFAAMERFVGLLGGGTGAGTSVTVATLFDGVTMESARSTLRRAAIVFAGRIPTEAEYASIETGGIASLRRGIRGLMTGPGFHEFLIRGANDRLLTDREAAGDAYVVDLRVGFVDFTNLHARYHSASQRSQSGFDEFIRWRNATNYGFARAPLELIAHVVKNDLPYTEILTADYIMANALSAEAYGATTAFDDPADVHEFRPSEIVSYYRWDDSKIVDESDRENPRVVDPGNLLTDYPHAGVLNTTVFMQRYPTTPTNRNRARSRWTYYHFLGLDIEKSASRTTDPIALADTSNPTLNNPACTVCHSVLDPVAGAFQNYGNEGYYRDQWGGRDSLAGFYKKPLGKVFPVEARSYEERETHSFRAILTREAGVLVSTAWNGNWDDFADARVALDKLVLYDDAGTEVDRVEFEDLASPDCGSFDDNGTSDPADDHWAVHAQWTECRLRVAVQIPEDALYRVDVVAWSAPVEGDDRPVQLRVAATPYRDGDVWYRGMRAPGLGDLAAPDTDRTLQWLAGQIVADSRFAKATVKFWWPAIMGVEVAEPPSEGDADFEGRRLASSAQAVEIERLAPGFRRGFGGGKPYNLKDLLAELVLSNWFRSAALTNADPTRRTALREAGAERLLTPEELARKTAAVTGFQWGRYRYPELSGVEPHKQHASSLTDDNEYRLLYGGIDSTGIVDRVDDVTSMMAGVAKSHAMESSCPIIAREFYLLTQSEARLFSEMDKVASPDWEDISGQFAVDRQWRSVSLGASLTKGTKTVSLTQRGGNLLVDKLTVRDDGGRAVRSFEFEELDETACGQPWPDIEPGYFAFWCDSLEVPVDIPDDGSYEIEVNVLGEPAEGATALLSVDVYSADTVGTQGSRAIKARLVELHEALLGVEVDTDSPDVIAAYDLFVDVWMRKREEAGSGGSFWQENLACDRQNDLYFYEGIIDDPVVLRTRDDGSQYFNWNQEQVYELEQRVDFSDRRHVARTWVVVLAYLMMDYRYLYL